MIGKKGDHHKCESADSTGFQPVNPWRSVELGESKRQLPHLQTPQSTYFVTFRCRDGMSLPDEAKEIVMSAIRYWDEQRIDLDAAVVMPDHVHAIFRVLEDKPLGSVMQSIKGFSARTVNRVLGRKGALWLDESFDHIIRHEQEWEEKVVYIRNNPIKAGLVESWRRYPWLWIKG
ncbi:MAG: REP-associated tyrosine transposase [Candidatus Binataceae bacterium]